MISPTQKFLFRAILIFCLLILTLPTIIVVAWSS